MLRDKKLVFGIMMHSMEPLIWSGMIHYRFISTQTDNVPHMLHDKLIKCKHKNKMECMSYFNQNNSRLVGTGHCLITLSDNIHAFFKQKMPLALFI